MSIDVLHLRSFIAIVETGCFSKAAARINRSQSAVSQQLAKLESTLGKKLIVRGKTATLTNEGEIFLGYAKQIVSLYHQALHRFKTPDLAGELRFGMPEDFASVYLSEVLLEFARLHPKIFVNVECDLTINLFEKFKRKELDIVLVKMSRPQDFPYGVEVFKEKLQWVSHADLHQQHDNTLPLVLSPQPCVYRKRAIAALEQAGIKWRMVFSSPSYAGTIAAVKAGLGITVLPKTMIPSGLSIAKLALPPLHDTHICLLKHQIENAALNSFEQFVLQKMHH